MVSPIRRRDAVAFLVRRHRVSERRACKVVGQHRSTQRYAPVPGDFEQRLIRDMRQLAEAHPRWGYRRVHVLLVEAGWAVNLKRVERLWRLEGLRVPDRNKHTAKKGGGSDANSAWALPAIRPNHVWSYDFVAARTVDGGPLRILNIVDEFTREAVASHVARSIGAREVVAALAKVGRMAVPTTTLAGPRSAEPGDLLRAIESHPIWTELRGPLTTSYLDGGTPHHRLGWCGVRLVELAAEHPTQFLAA